MKDEEIVYKLKNNDTSGLDALIDRFSPYVCAIIRRISEPPLTAPDTEEMAADIFISIWKNPRNINADDLKKYLAAAARNKAISRMRTYRSSVPIEDADYVSDDDTELETERQITSHELAAALDELEADDRTIIVQTYYYDRPVSDTAAMLRITANAAKTRLFRARKKLKTILMKRGFDK